MKLKRDILLAEKKLGVRPSIDEHINNLRDAAKKFKEQKRRKGRSKPIDIRFEWL